MAPSRILTMDECSKKEVCLIFTGLAPRGEHKKSAVPYVCFTGKICTPSMALYLVEPLWKVRFYRTAATLPNSASRLIVHVVRHFTPTLASSWFGALVESRIFLGIHLLVYRTQLACKACPMRSVSSSPFGGMFPARPARCSLDALDPFRSASPQKRLSSFYEKTPDASWRTIHLHWGQETGLRQRSIEWKSRF
jgi:hypothetical protein